MKPPRNTATLFSDKSDLYRRARPTYPPALYQFLADQCVKHEHVWDCATGNGQAAQHLINHFERVSATDISAPQISEAKTHPFISYQRAAAEKTPFADNSFDLITVAQALHWFDHERFWPEVRRVLRPDGVFAAWGYNWPAWGDQLHHVITTQVLNIIHPYFAANNQLLWDEYRDLEFPFNRIHSPSFNMMVQYSLDQLFDLLHSASATRRCIDDQGDGFFKQAYRTAEKIWGDANDVREFKFDLVLLVGRHVQG